MSRQSIARFFHVPPDQRTPALLALVAILTLLVPIIQLAPSPAFYVIDPIVIIVGVLLIILYIRFIGRKELIFSITDHLSTLNDLVTATFIKDITVLYKGRVFPNLHTALLRIQNRGNTEIEKRDFHNNPITICQGRWNCEPIWNWPPQSNELQRTNIMQRRREKRR